MLRGPQNDRSRNFEAGAGREDILAPERGGFESETTRLRRENGILKDQLQRSLKELKAYQEKYPSAYVTTPTGEGGELPPWTSSPDIMAPLFEAYDTRVRELESIVHYKSEQLKSQTANIQNVIAENEELREAQLQHLRNQSSAAQDHMLHPSGPIHTEVLAEMNERIDILMSENALLMEQKVILTGEMDALQADMAQRTQEVALLSEQLSATSLQLQRCAAQGVQTEKERDEAAKQAVMLSDAVGRMDGEMQAVREQLVMWQQKSADGDNAVAQLKKRCKETLAEAEESNTSCVRRTKVAEERVKAMHTQVVQKSQELESTQEFVRKLRRENQSTKQDAEGMLQVMAGMERQLVEYTSREADVERASREATEKVEEAMVARDRAIAREDQARREIEKLLEERKRTQERRQADIDAAAEQARAKAMEQVRRCEAEVRSTVEAAVRGRTDADKAIREGKAATEGMRRQEHLHLDEQRALEGIIKELRESLTAALLGRGEEASKKVDILEMNKELRAVVEKLRLDADALQGQLNASERARLSEGSTLKTSVREQQKELQDRARTVARKTKEQEELKQEAERRLLEVTARLEDECSTLRRRVAEAEAATKDLEGAAATEDQRTQMLVEQLRDKGTMLTAQLEASLRAEIEHGRKTSSKNRELEATAHLLSEEKAMLVVVIEEARSTISDLQEDLLSARDTILDLTESLSESHTAREEASQRAANVLEALEPHRGGGGGGGGGGKGASQSHRRGHARSAAAEGLEAKGE